MLRVLLYVALLGALFVGAVLSAGNAIGAWEPAVLPVSSTTDDGKGHKAKKHHGKADERGPKHHKKHG
jgi:hypothetical protein